MCYNGGAVPCTHHRFLLFFVVLFYLLFAIGSVPVAFFDMPLRALCMRFKGLFFLGCSFTAFMLGCVCVSPAVSQKLRDSPTTFPKIRTRFISSRWKRLGG